jgi:hypothetical protein
MKILPARSKTLPVHKIAETFDPLFHGYLLLHGMTPFTVQGFVTAMTESTLNREAVDGSRKNTIGPAKNFFCAVEI